MNARLVATSLVLLGPLLGCSGGTEPSADLYAQVVTLEARARVLAKADGCGSADECRAAPLGRKACGGPRDYIVYCAVTTDEPALLSALDSLAQAEDQYNRRSGTASDCLFVEPPALVSIDGTCQAIHR